mgnify:CR=1 FL=1
MHLVQKLSQKDWRRQNEKDPVLCPLSLLKAYIGFDTSIVWIQISGASLLSGLEIASKTYGQPGSKIYNDLQGVSEVRDIIAASPKRAVDHTIRNLTSSQPHIRTAIVYGPLIYGKGRGPINQRSIQIPDLAKAILQYGHGIHVGRGLNAWNSIHITDLTRLIVRLVIEASRPINPLLWNENGIFFAESGKMVSKTSFLSSSAFIKAFSLL